MSDAFDESITFWIHRLKEGDPDAPQPLWNHFFQQLTGVARRKLGGTSRRVSDEEDVALTAFQSLCAGVAEGRFERLENRDDLWQVLVALASRKAVDQIRRQVTQKRGGGSIRGDSIFYSSDGDVPGNFDQFLALTPTPELISAMDEECRELLAMLPEEVLRRIAQLRLEGYANEEIAEALALSPRTIERKLAIIRNCWSKVGPETA
ncbi:MAG TPA: ECF-type sigma factor [Planctomycetaceae bacterium]|nr:ECF-type sigma factor [Planctomycetaceae bacterium]